MESKNKNSRRKFLKYGLATTAMVAVGLEGVSSLFASNHNSTSAIKSDLNTGFDQKPLPYQYDALEDCVDAMTMEIHYSKHAATYVKNLNDAAKLEAVDMSQSVDKLLESISKYSMKLRNNAGGHYNHEMFWQCMRPKVENNKPSGKLFNELESQFGGFDGFKKQFTDAGKNRFGSGWVWLCKDHSGKLVIGSTANQDNPLMDINAMDIKGYPLLGLDVWEHAYYLKYQNKRADYIEKWWSLVNWDYVEKRFNS